MDEKELLKEKFKAAVSSAVKVISEKFDIEIKFSNNINSKKDSLTLPEVASLKKLEDFTNFRAFADSEALKLKYTNSKIFSENEPKGTIAKALYSIAEKIRYEKIGSEKLKGVKNNIIQCYENKFKGRKIDEIKTEADVPIAEAFELYLRSYFFNIKQNTTTKKVLSYWKDLFDKKLKKNLNELNGCVENQAEFNHIIAELIDNLEFKDSDSKEKEENGTTEDNPLSENTNNENNSTDEEQNQQADDDLSVADNDIDSLIENDSLDQNETDEVKGNPSAIKIRQKNFLKKKYKIFTNEYDEITEAKDLENENEITRLRKNLDQQLTNLQNIVTKLANKLQRQLLAKQNRSWEFDLEEGMLDSSKLSRVIINPLHSLSYKNEKETEFKDTVVTLLIDNSGSMRGRPISVAAICADILSRTLERCSVKVEILGFTTKNWKGGRSREKWNLNNKPANPGRLNDLRHIIYKSADEPWRRSKKNLGLMLKEDLLKENIDGEALLWAFKRITKRKEERKILMIISDGAPVDDSTLSVNSGDYLEKHLKQTVKWIEDNSNVEILAVGIGHDVTRYYKKAIKIADAQELGDVMINQLTKLFSEKTRVTVH
ncbi:MAG: cobalamin biosynthesis protein CobT [Pelagibacteraceae bacterium]|jgi:cobaltochelatase CobT|nr:cobalamin biosynthesis protein CobT [Candidatus Pelagibacter sp.]MDP6681005.1 cobalamin biosynthesis protein CobT [Pelagibacteraceae bacterium]MDP6710499.1 cobalamin biosynthesis protein CobT [Pelagibacteraceae bacterium]